jgi:hypothetical protein
MIPGYWTTTATTATNNNDQTSTAGPDNNTPYVVFVSAIDRRIDEAHLLQMIRDMKKIEVELWIPIRPKFDRMIKMRNTDGRPIRYSTWKPPRMLCGRDNIGTRNFGKMN